MFDARAQVMYLGSPLANESAASLLLAKETVFPSLAIADQTVAVRAIARERSEQARTGVPNCEQSEP